MEECESVVISFCTAWICGIAYSRELLSAESFIQIPFGGGKIHALRVPEGRKVELRHAGLFAWLSRDAPQLIRDSNKQGSVLVLIWQERTKEYRSVGESANAIAGDEDEWEMEDVREDVLVEAYEMRWSVWDGKNTLDEERMQVETRIVLRAMSEYATVRDRWEGDFRVELRVCRSGGGDVDDEDEDVKDRLRRMRRVQMGRMHTAWREIVCSVFVG